MIANTAVYCGGAKLHVDVKPDHLDGLRTALQHSHPGAFVSVGLHEPDEAEMARVAEVFGLHRLAVEDCVHAVQRPKVEEYGDMVFLVLKTLRYIEEGDTVQVGQVALFMGPDYVVTVSQGSGFDLERVHRELEDHADVLREGPCAVLYAVSDAVVDIYEDIVSDLQAEVDQVEASVFSGKRTHASRRIHQLNGELTTVRGAVEPLQVPMQQFAHADVPGVSSEAAVFFRDVADHVTRVSEAVDALDDRLSSAFDANLSIIGVQQNDDMRRMSAWAAIAAVITVTAGIYGMNFTNMPELKWRFGYPAVVLVMTGLSVWLYRNFKRKGWL